MGDRIEGAIQQAPQPLRHNRSDGDGGISPLYLVRRFLIPRQVQFVLNSIAPKVGLCFSGLVLFLMAGCTTPGTPGSTTPGTAGTTAEVRRFEDSTSRVIRGYLEPRGWVNLGLNTPRAGNQTMVFVAPASLGRTGSQARARELHVYAGVQPGPRPVMARSWWSQFDCDNRTAQILQGEEYGDQLATQRLAVVPAIATTLTVTPNSARESIMLRACGSPRPIAAGPGAPGGPPGAAPRGGTGSGVVIGHGLVLTNQHVVARCSAIDTLLAGQRLPAKLRRADAAVDLALLEVPGLPAVPSPGLRAQAAIGEPVMVAGFPLQGVLSSDLIVTDGLVNSLAGLAGNKTQMQISAPVQPGNSGGPLLDRQGNLVGLVVAKLDALRALVLTGDIPQNINFAIRPEVLVKFLEPEQVPASANEAGQRLETQELAERARAFTMKVECRP